jgi:hypothetical protein
MTYLVQDRIFTGKRKIPLISMNGCTVSTALYHLFPAKRKKDQVKGGTAPL